MSNPRFTPRRYTSEPENFGRTREIGWVDDTDGPDKVRSTYEQDRFAAARLQHQYAVGIRRRARTKHGSLKVYAEECGIPYDRLAKVMRGEVIMRLEDIVQAERILGGILDEKPKSTPTRRMEQVGAKLDQRNAGG